MRSGFVAVAGVVLLSGCVTGGINPSGGASARPTAVSSGIVRSMDGGLVSTGIGSQLDRGDRRRALEAEYRTLEFTPAGQGVNWQGDSAGVSGQVTAAQPYRVGSQDCRQYTHQLTVNGQTQANRGTACRNPDGSWTPLT